MGGWVSAAKKQLTIQKIANKWRARGWVCQCRIQLPANAWRDSAGPDLRGAVTASPPERQPERAGRLACVMGERDRALQEVKLLRQKRDALARRLFGKSSEPSGAR